VVDAAVAAAGTVVDAGALQIGSPPGAQGRRRQPGMAHPLVSSKDAPNPPTPELKVVVANKHGENLVGMLHHAGSNKVVVLCHGFVACKDDGIMD